MADVLVPAAERRGAAGFALDAALVVAGSLLVALSAQVAVPLPFTPVPVTAQPFAVLLVGAVLGSGRGALAMAAYLAEGAAGLPFFYAGGCCVPHLLGPTAGYLWSYPLAAWVVGRLAERGWDRRFPTAAAAMVAGSATIYLVALPWLSVFVGWDRVVAAGFLPFVAGDLVKIAAATAVLPAAWSAVGRARRWAGEP